MQRNWLMFSSMENQKVKLITSDNYNSIPMRGCLNSWHEEFSCNYCVVDFFSNSTKFNLVYINLWTLCNKKAKANSKTQFLSLVS